MEPARRILVVGASDGGWVLDLARGVPPDGLVICIDGDRAAAARATSAFAREGLRDRAHVILGDPALAIRKVAGPFDLIALAGCDQLAGRVRGLLAPGGRILTV
jgi:predicted O-methyltransferase YrrM